MILETEYLRLKEMRQDDLKMMLQDPDVMYAYEHNFSDADVQSWLDRNIKRYKDFGFGLWGIYLKETDEFIGNAGLSMQYTDVEQVIEIGYLLKKEFWHKGYASEITKHDNIASQKVAKKLGMIKEKEFMTEYYNGDMLHYLYSISK
ncbi:GNAT family N-acetyltransferase [Bacillus wiedmannii]|uniref:GNAT family N-acetyltransferase n=1 Tax=Bacillus wiedmannii TaxID=1890302 RepID=UPI000BF061B1|nr:GNAT family N-acetyltransferase [Bacillus wiedmannii]PEJ96872.1 GNAT family N-acetyltransferase [Bacillus wiedmannii]PEP26980.1 GNAT family N-acetyltransferase [Bacillus wiedmannii]PFZ36005.1 GNAT family N-acetyltransferase [Bacillus wiedmannii]PGA78875.1 GNAT family N-acetyltransferase [Bacillus wiedmannii]